MKLKTLMKSYNGSLVIFRVDYANNHHLELIARIGCVKSDTEYYFEDKFETVDESMIAHEKVSNSMNLNIDKMYVNVDGKLVVYVK